MKIGHHQNEDVIVSFARSTISIMKITLLTIPTGSHCRHQIREATVHSIGHGRLSVLVSGSTLMFSHGAAIRAEGGFVMRNKGVTKLLMSTESRPMGKGRKK